MLAVKEKMPAQVTESDNNAQALGIQVQCKLVLIVSRIIPPVKVANQGSVSQLAHKYEEHKECYNWKLCHICWTGLNRQPTPVW